MAADQVTKDFVSAQADVILPGVIRKPYPEYNYAELIPDAPTGTSDEWMPSVVFQSSDVIGEAEWLSTQGTDMPLADNLYESFTTKIYDSGIGFAWTISEVEQARRIGLNLPSERAFAARRVAQQFIHNIAINGSTAKGMTSLINASGVTKSDAPEVSGSRLWTVKDGDIIVKEFNALLSDLNTASLGIELANTVLLPPSVMNHMASNPRSSSTDTSILQWIRENNIYTQQTGQPLLIRALRGLEDAAAGNAGRAIAYVRDPDVLRFHLPMPHRFFEPFQQQWNTFVIGGMMRIGGVEILRPGAMRYLDLISS